MSLRKALIIFLRVDLGELIFIDSLSLKNKFDKNTTVPKKIKKNVVKTVYKLKKLNKLVDKNIFFSTLKKDATL